MWISISLICSYQSQNYQPPTAVDWFTAEDIAIVWRGISFKKDTINGATTEGWISSSLRYKPSDAVLTVSLSLYPTGKYHQISKIFEVSKILKKIKNVKVIKNLKNIKIIKNIKIVENMKNIKTRKNTISIKYEKYQNIKNIKDGKTVTGKISHRRLKSQKYDKM